MIWAGSRERLVRVLSIDGNVLAGGKPAEGMNYRGLAEQLADQWLSGQPAPASEPPPTKWHDLCDRLCELAEWATLAAEEGGNRVTVPFAVTKHWLADAKRAAAARDGLRYLGFELNKFFDPKCRDSNVICPSYIDDVVTEQTPKKREKAWATMNEIMLRHGGKLVIYEGPFHPVDPFVRLRAWQAGYFENAPLPACLCGRAEERKPLLELHRAKDGTAFSVHPDIVGGIEPHENGARVLSKMKNRSTVVSESYDEVRRIMGLE